MKSPIASEGSVSLSLLLARLCAGVTLVYCGYSHVAAPGGVGGFVASNISSVPAYMPGWFGNLYLHAVPFAEMALGGMLVLGLMTRLSALLAAAMLISFGLVRSGHMGFVNTHPAVPSQLLQAPAVFGAFALIALFGGPGRFSVDAAMFARSKKKGGKKPEGH